MTCAVVGKVKVLSAKLWDRETRMSNVEGALGADDLFGFQGNRKGCPYG